MDSARDGHQLRAIKCAVALVTEAMDLLDAHGAAPDAAANLAMAQQRLRDILAGATAGRSA
jgi:hypothetical protein